MCVHNRDEDTTSPGNTSRQFYTAVPILCSYFMKTPTFFVLVTATLSGMSNKAAVIARLLIRIYPALSSSIAMYLGKQETQTYHLNMD